MEHDPDRAALTASEAGESGWNADPFEQARELAATDPEALPRLVRSGVARLPNRVDSFLAALSFLPLAEFPALVQDALDALARDRNDEVWRLVIEYISLQHPPALHLHLTALFHLYADGRRFGQWPWRESGTIHLDFLRGVLEAPTQTDEAQDKAWYALLETRHPEALSWVEEQARLRGWDDDDLDWVLDDIGYEMRGGRIRKLYADQSFHLIFPMSYFPGASKEPVYGKKHPSCRLPTSGAPVMWFGGPAEGGCSLCGGGLHRMISLDPVPAGLGVTSRRTVELATCLSCLGWEQQPLFYRHDGAGKPRNIGYDGPRIIPEFPVGPLPATEVRVVATPPRWRWQDWGMSNLTENINRVGSLPWWVQDPELPACPRCGQTMRFLMQLGSGLPDAEGDEWFWGSGGVCYVSWCDGCAISGFLWQCT